jgi:hypothetical protein
MTSLIAGRTAVSIDGNGRSPDIIVANRKPLEVQISGTVGGGTYVLQRKLEDGTYADVTDSSGSVVSFTAVGTKGIIAAPYCSTFSFVTSGSTTPDVIAQLTEVVI